MRGEKGRCEHCGKWVTIQHEQLYTLFGEANGHPEEESVAVCKKCSDKYKPDYWFAWLEKRFAKPA